MNDCSLLTFSCLSKKRFGLLHASKRCIRQAIGPFLSNLAGTFDSVTKNAPTAPTLAIFSGHDGTIGRVLAALGVEETRWPAFCSNITFEIYRPDAASVSQEDEVRIRYNERWLDLPFAAAKPNQSSKVAPLRALLAHLEDILHTP